MTDWQGCNVLVTGSEGFIGSHLVEALIDRGANVRAHVLYNSFNSWGWLDSLEPQKQQKLDVFMGDVTNPYRTAEAVEGMDVVLHLAALIGIPYSYHAPEAYVATNVSGTLNVLQAARRYGASKVVVTSTSEVYGSALRVPIDEDHPLQGQSPYSASKIGADMIAASFAMSFEMPVAICRPFNTYGPRQSNRAVIPTIIAQLLDGAAELHLGNLETTRDFNYVKDTAEGFIALAESEASNGEAINLATGEDISIGDLAKMLMEITGQSAEIVTDTQRVRPARSEVQRLLGDATKARKLLGWAPRHDLRTGLAETVEWMKRNRHRYKAHQYVV